MDGDAARTKAEGAAKGSGTDEHATAAGIKGHPQE